MEKFDASQEDKRDSFPANILTQNVIRSTFYLFQLFRYLSLISYLMSYVNEDVYFNTVCVYLLLFGSTIF